MKKTTTKRLIDDLTCRTLGLKTPIETARLNGIALELQEIARRRNKEGFDTRQTRQYVKLIDSLITRAWAILSPYGFTVWHDGDPRVAQLWAIKDARDKYAVYKAAGGSGTFDFFLRVKSTSIGIPIIIPTATARGVKA